MGEADVSWPATKKVEISGRDIGYKK